MHIVSMHCKYKLIGHVLGLVGSVLYWFRVVCYCNSAQALNLFPKVYLFPTVGSCT